MENEGKKKDVEIKTKSPMWVVILIAVLVIALGCEFVYLANQRRAISEMMQQNQVKVENINDNELKLPKDDDSLKFFEEGTYGEYVSLPYKQISEESKENYVINYSFKEKELFISDGTKKEMLGKGKEIKQFNIGTTYDGMKWEATYKPENKEYNFETTLYILYKDGTVGKISTTDIKNKNYKITKLDRFTNIEYFVVGAVFNTGFARNLYAVDNNGNLLYLDIADSGC